MKIESLMVLAIGVLMLGTLTAECGTAAPQPPDLGSRIADRADLADFNLTYLNLSGKHLNQSDLRGADLSGCDLSGAYLRSAWLTNSRLQGTKMIKPNLTGAILDGADLSGSDLSQAILADSKMSGMLQGLARIEAAGYAKLAELGAPPVKRVVTNGGGAKNTVCAKIRERLLGVPVSMAQLPKRLMAVLCWHETNPVSTSRPDLSHVPKEGRDSSRLCEL